MKDEQIKELFTKEANAVSIIEKIEVIKRFILDKTNEKIEVVVPVGKVCLQATMYFQQIISDLKMLEYFYTTSMIYYKKTIK